MYIHTCRSYTVSLVIQNSMHDSTILKNACVRQVVLDKSTINCRKSTVKNNIPDKKNVPPALYIYIYIYYWTVGSGGSDFIG